MEEFFSKAMPYPISSCLANHRVLLGSLFLSHPSRRSDFLSEDEEKLSSIYGIPLHRWCWNTHNFELFMFYLLEIKVFIQKEKFLENFLLI
jgi:hypothetical protein